MLETIKNIDQLKALAKEKLSEDTFQYLAGGSDDQLTLKRNRTAFEAIKIRPRRLVDVRNVDTTLDILGEQWTSPIAIAPLGWQGFFDENAELATARAASKLDHQMLVSTVSTHDYATVAGAMQRQPWFQLYPCADRNMTRQLLDNVSNAGCKVLVLTIDTPVIGNREKQARAIAKSTGTAQMQPGNLQGILPIGATPWDASMTWAIIGWLKANCPMKILLKGIMTHEDARLAVEHGADGVIVSNHGGRQLDSGLATIAALPEVVAAVNGRIPVLFDGGIRRGTDIFKALAIGADAVCIGRAFCYGLAAAGQAGVERSLEILQTELVRNMQLAGLTSLQQFSPNYVSF